MNPLRLDDIPLNGLNLIEASAGTGKTWTIAALYMRLLLEKSLKPQDILVVTYTKAATAELKERIRQRIVSTLEMIQSNRLPEDELETCLYNGGLLNETSERLLTRALYAFDDAAIFTIHGFCQRALSENAFETGSLFDTEMITDQQDILQECVADFWRRNILPGRDRFSQQLVASGQTPFMLLEQVKSICQHPEMAMLPESVDENYDTLYDHCLVLFQAAADIWRDDKGQVIDLLKNASLNQNSYKTTQIDDAAHELDSWFATDPSATCKRLKLFCADHIDSKTKKGGRAPRHRFFDAAQGLMQACEALENSTKRMQIKLKLELISWMRREVPRRKKERNVRCFEDLLTDLKQALHADVGGSEFAGLLRRRYQASLIDEFQDTDQTQWKIFRTLTSVQDYPLYIIGDPKQAIYSFRNADIHAYLSAASAAEPSRRWTLTTNRRSTPLLVQAVNTLFSSADNPFLFKGINFQAAQAGCHAHQCLRQDRQPCKTPLQFWLYGADAREKQHKPAARDDIAKAVAYETAQLLTADNSIPTESGEKRITPGDIAVLVRTHAQAELIQQALAAVGVPSVQNGNMSVLETDEAYELLRMLRAAAEPGRSALVWEAMLGGLLGISADTLYMILIDDSQLDLWRSRFNRMSEAFADGGAVALAGILLDECGARTHLLRLSDGERRLTNLMHCAELVHNAVPPRNGLENAIKWLESAIASGSSDDTHLLRLETDEQAVIISTIHASKGLQYPVVFIPFAWDAPRSRNKPAVFHNERNEAVLDLGSERFEEHAARAAEEEDAEAVRLLYVALTRAQYKCYMVWGKLNDAEHSPMARLLHGRSGDAFKALAPEELLDDLGRFCQDASGIAMTPMPATQTAPRYGMANYRGADLVCRKFRGDIRNDWRVASFSSISSGSERELQPHDVDARSIAPGYKAFYNTGEYSICDFPRGAEAGTCLHELFEKLDFASANIKQLEDAAKSCLARNGYDLKWLPAVTRMAHNVVNAGILPDQPGFRLSQLKPHTWVTEMEFYLPLEMISSRMLSGSFSGVLSRDRHGRFEELLSSLRLKETRGFLQGFIDMVFEYNGRYYIIDWKSNHLGNSCQDYSPEMLKEAMAEHAYILQYHLYTLALDRLLKLRLPGYEYEKHFGGAAYIFLRCFMAEDNSPGIYFDKPDAAFITKANQRILAASAS